MSDWREELFGDLLCTPAEHAPAAAAVGALQRSFTQAPAAVQAQFKGPVNALLSTWNAFEKDRVENLSKRLNPMFWCNFKTLAQNAQALQAQLAAAAPAAPARSARAS